MEGHSLRFAHLPLGPTERGETQCWRWLGSCWGKACALEEPDRGGHEPSRPPEPNLSLPGCAGEDTADSVAVNTHTHTAGANKIGTKRVCQWRNKIIKSIQLKRHDYNGGTQIKQIMYNQGRT